MENVKRSFWYIAVFVVFLFVAGTLLAGTPPVINVLSPTRGEDIPYGSEVVVAISIYDEEGDVDVRSIELEIDNTDVTRFANTSVFLATYRFSATEDVGRHTISFLIEDREGNAATLDSYFNIQAQLEKERKFTYNGNVGVGGEYDKEAPQSAIGNAEVYLYGNLTETLNYVLNIDATNEEASDQQRVSIFRFDMYSPIGGAVLGDTTPSFSDYTIDGEEVFGVHLLPQFGIIGAEFVYGQRKRSVEANDGPETFQQFVYGGRLKVGKPNKFLWGLNLLKVKDDKDSIDTTAISPTPKDNLVVGTDISISFLQGKISFKAEANESLLNEDITGGASSFADFDIGFDPDNWEWLFTINEHVVPLDVPLPSLAAKGALKIGPFRENTFNAEYSYVGPSFFSLANPNILNDRAGFLLSDNIWLLDRRLFLNGSYQNYHDNLEDNLAFDTDNIGYSVAAYVYPTDFLSINGGVDIYTVKNNADPSDAGVEVDDQVDDVNTTITTGAMQNLDFWITNSDVYFNGTISLFNDNIDNASDLNNYYTRLGAISYFNDFPLDTRAVLGFDFGDSPNSAYLEGGAGYRFLMDQSLYASTGLIYETGPEQLEFTIGAEYDVTNTVNVEADFDYVTAPGADDLFISAFATWEF
jgi:hypothetical protein